jgi:hypothetical protein
VGTKRNSNHRQEPNGYQHRYRKGRPRAVCVVVGISERYTALEDNR